MTEKIHHANWDTRIWAWLIDILIVGVSLNLILYQLGSWDFKFVNLIGFSIYSVVLFIYWTLLEWKIGRSVGKMLMHIKVTDVEGKSISFISAVIESLGKSFALVLDCLIGWVVMPRDNVRLFNRLSNTVVIQSEYEGPTGFEYFEKKTGKDMGSLTKPLWDSHEKKNEIV